MFKFKFTKLEIAILAMVFILVIIGVVISFKDMNYFKEHYVVEDGPIEWLTVVGLLIGAGVCFNRAAKLYKSRGFLFSLFTIGLGVLMILAAGEEISWGQRIFGIESSDFFKENNAQAETNFHNMVVGGVKLNKLIFSLILSICLMIYMIIIPLIYTKNEKFKKFIDSKGVILPKLYHVVSLLALFGLTEIIQDGKKAELLEFGVVFIFLLIVFYPLNDHIYHKDSSIEK